MTKNPIIYNPALDVYQVEIDRKLITLMKSFYFSMLKLEYIEAGYSEEEADEIVADM